MDYHKNLGIFSRFRVCHVILLKSGLVTIYIYIYISEDNQISQSSSPADYQKLCSYFYSVTYLQVHNARNGEARLGHNMIQLPWGRPHSLTHATPISNSQGILLKHSSVCLSSNLKKCHPVS